MSKEPDIKSRQVDLEDLANKAPDGYKLPKAFVDLVKHATACGWESYAGWFLDSSMHPYLSIELRRLDPFWHAKLTWHSRPNGGGTDFVQHGRLRLFSGIWRHETIYEVSTRADYRVIVEQGWPWSDIPSLKKLREEIAANPVNVTLEEGNK